MVLFWCKDRRGFSSHPLSPKLKALGTHIAADKMLPDSRSSSLEFSFTTAEAVDLGVGWWIESMLAMNERIKECGGRKESIRLQRRKIL